MDSFKHNIQQAIEDSFLLEDFAYYKTKDPKYEDWTLSQWLWHHKDKFGEAVLKQIASFDNEEMIEELQTIK